MLAQNLDKIGPDKIGPKKNFRGDALGLKEFMKYV